MGVLVAVVVGCDGEAPPPPEDAGGSDAGEMVVDAGSDAGAPSNDTIAGATELVIAESPWTYLIESAGDVDYYRFEGTEGQWIVVTTTANPDVMETLLDTVVTLYDASETQIATNDASFAGEADSQLITRLPATGTFYLKVEDGAEPPRGMPSFQYELALFVAASDNPVTLIEAETGDDATSAIGITLSDDRIYLLGDLDDSSDVDVYSISIRTGGRHFWRSLLWDGGPSGNGSTTTPARVWITDETGSAIWAETDFSSVPTLEPALTGGTWLLWVEHPGGAAGANDFYVMFGRRNNDNPRELAEAANDDPTMAEEIVVDATRTPPRGFIAGFLADGDVDHWRLDASAGDTIAVVCGSQNAGSGIIGLGAELLDLDGATVLGSDREEPGSNLFFEEIVIPADGTYLLRMDKMGQEPAILGNWYRCGITRES